MNTKNLIHIITKHLIYAILGFLFIFIPSTLEFRTLSRFYPFPEPPKFQKNVTEQQMKKQLEGREEWYKQRNLWNKYDITLSSVIGLFFIILGFFWRKRGLLGAGCILGGAMAILIAFYRFIV
jgi:hypothetical protein